MRKHGSARGRLTLACMVALGLCAAATTFMSCGLPSSTDLSALPAGTATTGKSLYTTHCSSCHGASAGGGSGPNIKNQSSDEIQAAVRSGPGSMPTFSSSSLSDQKLADIIAYVDTL
jgi:mono/diheme cytochrome c family protein